MTEKCEHDSYSEENGWRRCNDCGLGLPSLVDISLLNQAPERGPFSAVMIKDRPHHRGWPDNFDPKEREIGPVSILPEPTPPIVGARTFEIKTGDPRFNAGEPVTINGHRYVSEKTLLAGLDKIRKALDEAGR